MHHRLGLAPSPKLRVEHRALRASAAAGLVVGALVLAGCSGPSATAPSATPGTGTTGSPSGPAAPASASASASADRSLTSATTDAAFAALEEQYGATVGVRVLDTGSGDTLGYRQDTRFAFASTSKALTAGLLLRTASDAELDAIVHYGQEDLLAYAPVTALHVDTGMSLRDLVTAALQQSDNTAANLVTEHLGGPAAVQRALRAIGDRTTNVDRTEPDLNEATPGDPRDTTTPTALASDLRGFAVGDLLTPVRRAEYRTLLEGNTTGGPYVRAGVPSDWRVGDKTGNGGHGTRNDIAVVTPPGHDPVVVAVLTNRRDPDRATDDALIADVTARIVTTLDIR